MQLAPDTSFLARKWHGVAVSLHASSLICRYPCMLVTLHASILAYNRPCSLNLATLAH